MRLKTLALTVVLTLIVSVSLIVAIEWFENERQSNLESFVGVEFAYGNVSDCKDLVDKVKDFTNLFVVGLPEISINQTLLNATCDYIYDAGLSFIIMFTAPEEYNYHPHDWIIDARQKYGDRFLGVYYYDEPGGNQLDGGPSRLVDEAKNYTDAANVYVERLYTHAHYYLYSGPGLFTADYGLYWFDYKARYDTVLAEFGWNHSRQLNVALCRGAAKVRNKDWGVMITWTYNGTPYIESGDELYNDMTLAYHAGAKYVVVFDYPKIGRYGILTEEHFEAMKKFWNYINHNPRKYGTLKGEVAYVLPQDYGFGFRSSNDTIWGLWDADQLSKKIWDDVNNLLDSFSSDLDIVYSDPESNGALSLYKQIILWNETATQHIRKSLWG